MVNFKTQNYRRAIALSDELKLNTAALRRSYARTTGEYWGNLVHDFERRREIASAGVPLIGARTGEIRIRALIRAQQYEQAIRMIVLGRDSHQRINALIGSSLSVFRFAMRS
jgi:hypothetical protein